MSAVSVQTSEYELVLMLDPEAPDERRDQIAADALKRIEAGGSLKHDRAWGMRKLAYEIRQRTEADYRFFRFESEPPVLDELNHSLKITDGVLRFRIFEVDPDSPLIEPPPPVSLASAASGGRGPGGPRRGDHGDDQPASAPEATSAPAPAAAPEPVPAAESGDAPEQAATADAPEPQQAPAPEAAPPTPEAAPPAEDAPASDEPQGA